MGDNQLVTDKLRAVLDQIMPPKYLNVQGTEPNTQYEWFNPQYNNPWYYQDLNEFWDALYATKPEGMTDTQFVDQLYSSIKPPSQTEGASVNGIPIKFSPMNPTVLGSYNLDTDTISFQEGRAPSLGTLAEEVAHQGQDLAFTSDIPYVKANNSSESYQAYATQPIERMARGTRKWFVQPADQETQQLIADAFNKWNQFSEKSQQFDKADSVDTDLWNTVNQHYQSFRTAEKELRTKGKMVYQAPEEYDMIFQDFLNATIKKLNLGEDREFGNTTDKRNTR